jgi:hypothetical protein
VKKKPVKNKQQRREVIKKRSRKIKAAGILMNPVSIFSFF